MDTPLLSRAATVASATLLSRLLGVGRDMCMAWLLGGPAADMLVPALRLPNLARRLLGEGTLSISLTAAFSRLLPSGMRPDMFSGSAQKTRLHDVRPNPLASISRLASSIGARLICILICAVALGELFAYPLLSLLAPGFAEQPEIARNCVFLLRICLPYIIFAGATAVVMALLHSLRRFFLASAGSIFFNLTMIGFAVLAALHTADPALLLASGILCGGITQFLILTFVLHKSGIRFFPASLHDPIRESPTAFSADTSDVRGAAANSAQHALRRLPFGILGAAAPQLALLAAGALASRLSEGSLAALYYAERVLDFPLGIAGVALGTASLPSLTALAAARHDEPLQQEAGRALRLALCISLPAAAGLAATAEPLIRFLFFRGAFDAQALSTTVLALCAYAPALPAYAASRPLLSLCNACDTTRLTAVSACIAVPFAFFSGLALLPLGIIGPPLGFSLGMWAQFFILRFGLRRNNIVPPFPFAALLRYAAGSALVFAAARLFLHLLPESSASLMLTIVAAVILYFCFLSLTGEPDIPRFARRSK